MNLSAMQKSYIFKFKGKIKIQASDAIDASDIATTFSSLLSDMTDDADDIEIQSFDYTEFKEE
jgi:hypothetical protein